MFKKDYIQRQFEEFGKVLAFIMGYKKQGDLANFELEIEKAVATFTGLEIKEVLALSDIEFAELIKKSTHLKSEQIKILADLIYEKSFVYENTENELQFVKTLKRALFLYEWHRSHLTTNEFNIEINYRITLINKLINLPNQQ